MAGDRAGVSRRDLKRAARLGRRQAAAARTSSGERPFVTIAGLVLAVLFGVSSRDMWLFSRLELWLDDGRMVLLAPAVPHHPDVAVVTITEQTLAQTRRRSPIDREFLAQLLARLDDARPAAVGIDILFDRPTTPDEDGALVAQLHHMKTPVVLADGNPVSDPDQITEEQAQFLAKFEKSIDNPEVRPGLVRLPHDADETMRRVPDWSGMGSDSDDVPTFSMLLANIVGVAPPPPDARIAYYGEFDRPAYFHRTETGTVRNAETFPFLTIPAEAVVGAADGLGWSVLKRQLAGRVVLVGISVKDTDRLPTPFTVVTGVTAPGVMIHASLIAQMIDGRWIRTPSLIERGFIMILLVSAGFAIGVRSDNNWLTLSLLTTLIVGYWSFGILAYAFPIGHGLGRSLYPMVAPALATMAATALGYALTRRLFQAQRNFIEGALGKYVSPSVAEQLLAHPDLLKVGGERRVVTVLFTDIEGFTSLSESLQPVKLVDILNRYLDGMTRIVHDYEGTLDKYIGDALVVFWNAPLERVDHAVMAVGCALALAEFSEKFSRDQKSLGIPFGRTRIGVQTGPAIVGNFGGDEKLNYTAIGDTINIGSRLEGANKYLGTGILLGKETAAASGRNDLRPVCDLVVKGREEAVSVFEPVPDWDPRRIQRYLSVYHKIHAVDPHALAELEALAENSDPVILLYLNRLKLGHSGTRIVLDDK